MIYRSKAPFRIGLAGGGTDVSPFSDDYGGAVLNATINLYAHASIKPRDDNKIIITAIDRDEQVSYDSLQELEINEPALILQKGVCYRMIKEHFTNQKGFELTTYLDVSSGSGLGTSSTLVVAVLGVFVEWLKLPLGEYDIAKLAYEIERNDLKMAGGKQDQYAATFGGVNFMEFNENQVIVNPLRIKPEIFQDLEFNLVLFYTQTTRESDTIIKEQKENMKSKNEKSIEATKLLKQQAYTMKEALLKGSLAEIGNILNQGWTYKKRMAKGVTTTFIDHIYNQAIEAGASGGKISGAGGGGFMIFHCPYNTRYDVINALKKLNVQNKPYQFLNQGLTTWTSYQ